MGKAAHRMVALERAKGPDSWRWPGVGAGIRADCDYALLTVYLVARYDIRCDTDL
jgi:hypothetical protein